MCNERTYSHLSLCGMMGCRNAWVDPVYSPLFFVFFLHIIKGHLQFCSTFFSATERGLLVSGYKLWLQTLSNTKHTQNKDNYEAWLRSWGLVALTVPTTNGAPPRVPFGLLVSNTPTASPSRRTQTEDLGSAGAIGSEEMVKTARFARCQKIKRARACIRLTKDLQWGAHSCNTWTPPVLQVNT